MQFSEDELGKLVHLIKESLDKSYELSAFIHHLHENGLHAVVDIGLLYIPQCDHNNNNKPTVDIKAREFAKMIEDLMKKPGNEN